MKTSGFAKIGAVCAGALAFLIAGAPAAMAEPSPAGTFRTYSAVGSDTIQDVWNGLSNGVAGVNGGAAVVSTVGSYDAFPTGTVRTKSGGPLYNRPAGSGNGVLALSASNNSPFTFSGINIQNQVDFARSSSRPSSAFPGANLRYLPFARDAVSVVGRGLDADLINFTTAELTSIYSCTSGGNINVSGTTVTYNNGSTVNQVLRPILPQTGSGTRSFFLSAIGVATPAGCVSATTVPENSGTPLATTGQVVPFSAAQWIAQKNGVVTNTVSNAALRITSINGSAPTAGSGTALTPGLLYGSAATAPPTTGFARDTYSVADASDINILAADTALETTLTASVGTTDGQAVIAKYGFLNLGYLGVEGNYLSSGYTN